MLIKKARLAADEIHVLTLCKESIERMIVLVNQNQDPREGNNVKTIDGLMDTIRKLNAVAHGMALRHNIPLVSSMGLNSTTAH